MSGKDHDQPRHLLKNSTTHSLKNKHVLSQNKKDYHMFAMNWEGITLSFNNAEIFSYLVQVTYMYLTFHTHTPYV